MEAEGAGRAMGGFFFFLFFMQGLDMGWECTRITRVVGHVVSLEELSSDGKGEERRVWGVMLLDGNV